MAKARGKTPAASVRASRAPVTKATTPDEHAEQQTRKAKRVTADSDEFDMPEDSDDGSQGLDRIPDIDEATDDVDVDAAFVRMLNTRGNVVPVQAMSVPLKLVEGYRFIIDEPSIPIIVSDNPDKCYKHGVKGWRATGRTHPKVLKNTDALRLWVAFMRKDKIKWKGDPNLWHNAIDRAVDLYRKLSNPGDLAGRGEPVT